MSAHATLPLMRGYSALRRGRFSDPGATYFITFCTAHARSGLAVETVATALYFEIGRMILDRVWDLRTSTLMPDHVHLLVRLGERLSLSQAIGRLKAKTKPAFDGAGLAWQAAFYDHKLAPDDAVQSVIHYVFMNPYRAGLIPPEATWPWFRIGEEESQWFAPLYAENVAMPEWLAR